MHHSITTPRLLLSACPALTENTVIKQEALELSLNLHGNWYEHDLLPKTPHEESSL